jgi:hypothetical protein
LRPSTRVLTTDSLSPRGHTAPARDLLKNDVHSHRLALNGPVAEDAECYYTSFKLTDDHIEGFPDILIRGKNKVFAVGPEVQLALAETTRSMTS